ncbi:MAG: aromatic amino acid lyase, partial [Paracoccaceae bacterium]|nr:aromatic amino acid lyase [Paracoccaceae bacterium]
MTILTPLSASLKDLEGIWLRNDLIHLDRSAQESVIKSENIVREATEGGAAVYGVNTGFGKLASLKIPEKDTASLQRNLVLSHCCGVGNALDLGTTRLMIALKLLSLGRGASGVSWNTIVLMEDLLNNGIYPVIPDQGSVGASGDLAPLAHMAASLIGEGEVFYKG